MNTLIKIKLTSNNTITTIISNKITIATLSCGKLGFKGAKRSNTYSTTILGEAVADILKQKKLKNIILIFDGFTKNKKAFIKGLNKKYIKMKKIVDVTSTSHNGCRQPKKRRR